MNVYQTRTVEGMTRIPIRTIQDYVRDFRDHFSETARKPSKGRRFTAADVDILQTIQRLRSDRVQDAEIRKVLTGETPLKLAHQFDEAQIKDFAANALEYFEDASHALAKADQLLKDARAQIAELNNEKKLLQADYRALRDRVDRFKEWQIFVMKEIPELNPYDESKEKPGKGFVNRLLGG